MKCAAGAYDQPTERTVEVSFPSNRDSAGLPLGALVNLRATPVPTVCVYRVDAGVRVVVPQGVELMQQGLVGRVVRQADLLELLNAAVCALLVPGALANLPLREAVARYALELHEAGDWVDAHVLRCTLRETLARLQAQGVDNDEPGYAAWRALLAKLEDA